MPEIILVRKKCCEGCLYSATPAARDAEAGKEHMAREKNDLFFCHCHWRKWDPSSQRVLCRGFYEAHNDRLPEPRFTKKKGKFWQWWLKVKPGTAQFGTGTKKDPAQLS
jgi:hypothetical protein